MHAADDRPEFAPPPQPGLLRAFALAVLAHVLLIAALTHGLRWQREAQNAAVEAELWSALPQQAAPKEEPPPPPPPPQPVVKAPPLPPVVKAPPEPPARSQADIALEREKEKRLERQRREAELEKQRAKAEAQKKREQELARREEELAKKKELQKKQLAEAKRKEEEKRRKQEEQEAREAKVREQIRKETINRNMALAGTGSPSSEGAAARSAGPSGSWGGKVQALVVPRIVFTEQPSSSWVTDVEVRMAPSGLIMSRRIVKPSGSKAWDDAVLRALDSVQTLPKDTDGRAPTEAVIGFRPRK